MTTENMTLFSWGNQRKNGVCSSSQSVQQKPDATPRKPAPVRVVLISHSASPASEVAGITGIRMPQKKVPMCVVLQTSKID